MKHYNCEDLGDVFFLERLEDANEVYTLLDGDEPIAFDTETSGLLPYMSNSMLRLAQLGTFDVAYVWDPNRFPSLTLDAVTTRPVWYWNAGFDRLWLDAKLSITLEETAPYAKDASILHRLFDPRDERTGGTGHSLKAVCDEWLDLDREVGDARKIVQDHAKKYYKLKKDEFWAHIPIEDYVYITYAGQDVLLTSRIGELLEDFISIPQVDQADIAHFEHRLADCMTRVTRRGWEVDREHTKIAQDDLREEFNLYDNALEEFGIPPVKSSGCHSTSDTNIAEALQSYGWTPVEFTDTGSPSLKAEVLEEIVESYDENNPIHRIASYVLKARDANKQANTFLENVLKYSEFDSRIHAFIKPLGTVTGRMSSSEPNMQNFPREPETIRGCLVAEEGHTLVSIDYSGFEWRVAAVVTGDEGMKKAFAEGRDIHKETANLINVDKQTAKTASLASLYGGGVNAIMNQCGVTEDLAKLLRETIKQAYPGIRESVKRNYEFVEEAQNRSMHKEVRYTYITGRQAVVDNAYPLGNYIVQAPARDIMAEAIIRVFDAGYGDMVRSVVHDEIIFSAPEDRAEDIAKTLQDIMEVPNWKGSGVDIVADGNILGKRWKKS